MGRYKNVKVDQLIHVEVIDTSLRVAVRGLKNVFVPNRSAFGKSISQGLNSFGIAFNFTKISNRDVGWQTRSVTSLCRPYDGTALAFTVLSLLCIKL